MCPDASMVRGLDGLTASELAASRQGWWDEAFADVLLRRVPGSAKRLIDVGCGLATAAHAMLPKLPCVAYCGIDADEQRLHQAENLLVGVPYRDRVELCVGRAECLPFQEHAAEVVLTSMTLQHVPDSDAAVRDIARVLAPGGVFIAVEPDNTANEFYFDGVLGDVMDAFRDLFKAQRRERHPRDIAIGPAVAALVERQALQVLEFFPYVVGRAKKMTAKNFFDGARQVVNVVAASLPADAREVEAVRATLDTREAVIGRSAVGYGCQFVPMFVCVARKA